MTTTALEQTKALRVERMKSYDAYNALLDDIAGKERSAEREAELDRMDADIVRMDKDIKRLADNAQREIDYAADRAIIDDLTDGQANRLAENENTRIRKWLDLPEKQRPDLSLNVNRARTWVGNLRAGITADEMRAMNWQTSSGSLIVPTTTERALYTFLEASAVAFRIGANQFATSSGNPLLLPKLLAHGIAVGSIPQGTAVGGTDPTFNQVSFKAYKYGQLVAVSAELVRDSVFDISTWLGQDIGYAIGRLVDTDLVLGTGTSQPTGMTILAGSGTNAPVYTGGSLITPTYEKMVDTVYSVNDAYRQLGASWLMKDSSAGTLRKLRDGAGGTVGAVLWRPSLTQGIQGGQPDLFLDAPVYIDFNCATQGSNAIFATFGWFGEYTIRTVGDVMIDSSEHLYFDKDQIAFRGKYTLDGQHRDITALNSIQMHV